MKIPSLSIIIPVYNVEMYLTRCLHSVICQTYNNIEIILVNDGSTDDSLKICQEFALDTRIVGYRNQYDTKWRVLNLLIFK